jgi:hypothetical protein
VVQKQYRRTGIQVYRCCTVLHWYKFSTIVQLYRINTEEHWDRLSAGIKKKYKGTGVVQECRSNGTGVQE